MTAISLSRSSFITCFMVVTQSLLFFDSNFTSEVEITQIWYFEGAEESTRLLTFCPAGSQILDNQDLYRCIKRGFNATGTCLFDFRSLALVRINGQKGRNTGKSGNTKVTTESPLEVGQGHAQLMKGAPYKS